MPPKTRSGRIVKAPQRYEPVEIPLDDNDSEFGEELPLGSDDEDEDVDLVGEGDYSDGEESESDEEDADDEGNLAGFVVGDDDEEYEDGSSEEEWVSDEDED